MLIPFDQLFSRHNIKTKWCAHIGSNFAQEKDAYRDRGIETVIWVEALPHIHAQAVKNLADYPGNTALCACLSDVDGQKVKFNIANNEAQSSSFLEFGTHSKEHPTVKFESSVEMVTTRFDTLMAANGIEVGNDGFLNIDVQGAELLVLRGMGELLRRFKYAYIEVNTAELYKSCPLVGEIDDYLAKFGFARKETKMTSHCWGDAYFERI